MTKLAIVNSMSRTFHRTGLKIKKHSPEILMVAGVVGTVAGAVMACKATLKVNEVLDESKTNIDKIHTAVEKGVTEAGREYTAEDSKKELTIVYARTGFNLVKLYAPAVSVGVLGITCMLASNNVLRKRNVALAAAYASVDKGFKEYRDRVIERFGKDLDRELKYNLKAEEIEETVVQEDGTETTVKRTVNVYDPNNHSPYAIIFDDGNTGWDKDPEVTKFFLMQQQNWANERLKARGHLFLNEVYDMLGANRTAMGQIAGWVYDPENPDVDNFVDFGMFDIHNPKTRDFINGRERVIILDFNVDGNILELIK
jgi:hypothetical protein